ncbi:MAG: Ig-like domain-containing protein [Chitinophagaceae bacterium]|nr:Ig-like domain-containing protein [Chitinophagaceae bacterium]
MTNRLLPNLSVGLQQSFRDATTTSAKWSKALLVLLGLVFAVGRAGAQTTETGHEVVRGEINFRAKAEYLRLHPEPLIIQWKDTARKGRIPLHLDPIDPTLLRGRPSAAIPVIPPSAPAPFMPVSPSPDTTFQSTLDNGTTIPPDTHGAIDSNYCVTAVNSAVRIQTRSGTSVSQISLNSFWSSVLPGGGAFDPRVHYDPYTNRWIMVAVSGAQSSTSSVLLAVSKTGNPTGDWWQYKITAYSAGDYWLDFPNVGINNKWITVSGVLFQNTGGGYGGCKTFIFDKSTVSSGASAPFTAITQTGSGNICPAITYSNTLGSMFMVEAWNGGSRAMRLWKITGNVGSESMTSIGFPLADFPWWYQPFPVSGTSFGDNAPQLGVSNKINNGDNRVTQLIYRNNSLWFAHTIFLPYNASANPTRSAVQWWQTDTLGNPIQIGRVDDSAAGKFFAYPTIAVNNNNDALIGFSVFSSAMRPSAGYALRLSTDATDSIRTPVVYRNGQNSYYKTYGGSKNRWGDYSATMVDPVNNTDFWTIQEASHSTINMWDTWWARVVPTSSCSTPSVSGTLLACAGSGTTLTGSVSGGTWSSSNTSVATVGSASGVVAAVAAGTATISYTISGGCVGTAIYTVNALPATITGATSVCIGSTTTLASTTGGGTWASSNSGVASVGSTGIVSGIAAGTATITYTASGCIRATVVTVNSLPATISGTLSVCVGATTALSSATTGGTWATSASGIATVGSTGIVTGVATGTSTISYTVSGCRRTAVVTVLATPAVITGSTSVCAGATTTLSSATSGGTWASSATGIAMVGSTGIVTGLAAGTATISYAVSGCTRTTIVTVLATPAVITGSTSVCAGSTTTLSSATGGGTWASSATGTATVGSTGIVTGVAAGTATISYTVAGCATTTTVTVLAAPAAISGTMNVCVGATTALSSTPGGGSWVSSNTGVATVSSTGIVSGVSAGTANITYAVSGCFRVANVTVNPLSSAGTITGASIVCAGNTITLSNTTTGGTWSSSDGAIATVGSTGVVTGVSAGTVLISYSVSNACGSGIATKTLTVDPAPFAGSVTGSSSVCVGASVSLSDTVSGGSWTSSNGAIATVDGSGVVTGVASGSATISYTVFSSCGSATATKVITVNAAPSAGSISGASSVFTGSTITLTSSASGGTWSSGDVSIATVGSTGVVTGVSVGSVTISYTVTNGCGSSVATKMVMVNESVSTPITGTLTTCVGMTTTLSNATTGGTWTSGNTSVATIGSVSGIVTGVATGTSTITYSLGGVDVTAVVSVYATPAAISGPGSLCVGATISLSDATTGGVWTSSGTAVAMVDSSTGIVSGVSAGTAVISYSLAAGCSVTKVVTVNVTPGAISGSLNGCIGVTNSFTCTPTGGAWSSSTPSVANINSAGQATGAGIGTTTISYSLASGCRSTAVLTINTLPDSVSGTAKVCVGLTTTFTGFPGGGSWSSSNTGVATIDASGVITGVALGTARITYTNAGGCYKTKVVTVNAAPLSITGTAAVCVGSTTTLACPGGGTWASSDLAVGTISTTGVVRGISGGITTITYTLSTGCFRTRDVTVNSAPSAITGTANICVGTTTTLNSTPSGGTWSSSGLTVGTVGSTTGIVTGLSGGGVTISYTIAGGCRATRVVTVNNNPPAIGGTATLATGGTTTLTNALSGGSWSSGATGIATVGSTGIVFGVGAGTAVISYTSTAGCSITRIVTVTGAVGGITGVTSLCTGATTSLSCSPAGGTWASSTIGVATVNSTGVVTGVSAGTSTISYTISGTTSTVVVTVYATPSAITGPGSMCTGTTTTYTNAVAGGTWSSTNTSVATIGSTGTVTPIAAGTTTISYQMSAGCGVAKIITVNANPAAISGATVVCVGASGSLSCTTSGGAWSSSSTSVATIDGSGAYSGVSAGVATITYGTGSGCYSTIDVTVNPVPDAITGGLTECIGGTSTLSNTTSGGTWSSSNTTVGTIDASGVVTAITAGTTTITYSIGGACVATAVFTVNGTPAAIGGALSVCIGGNTTLTNPSSGGTWSSSTPAVGTISSGMGVFTGITSGVTTVTYTVGTGCFVTADVTVNALPGSISGTLEACASGGTTTLTCTPGGGVWVTTTPSVATIGSATGVVSGVISGTAVVTYTVGTGCYATAIVTVNAIPATITGTATACPGTTTNLTSTTAGGNWTSSNTAAATVNSSGVVTGVAAGTSTISYELSGCATTRIVTVYPLPGAVTGSSLLCSGTPATYTATPSGGTWSSGNTAVGTINITTGAFTGLTAGATIVTYKLATGCQSELAVSVNATPAAISGATTICLGNSVTLTSSTSGGAWTSSNTAVGTVNSSGIVTGITSGTTTISYSVGSCAATKVVTVNTVFASSSTFNMCIGGTKTLVDSLPGGTWSSSTPSVATVVSGTGVATAVAVGMTTITYTFGTGCTKTTPLYVQNSSAVISGPSAICEGSAASMTVPGASSGGSWTSSNPAVATINLSTGAVNAVSPGVVTISYTLIECITTKVVTINPRPATSTGMQFACVGLTTTLSNTTGGGSWVSSNAGIASVGSGTGVVTGVAAGVANISYTLPTGCFRSLAVTVAATPAAISGATNVCVGNTITMASTSPGGTWSSSNAAIGSVNASTGVVGGVASGVATISYGYGGSCFATKAVTVNPAAAAITGPDDVCAGLTITLANAVTPGTWSSSATGVATANASTGLITGVSAGTVNITYRTTAGGCTATKVVTVNAAMPAFTGGSAVCVGETITLANAVPGGTWSSSNTAKATIGSSSGVVTGVALGTSMITYLVSSGCFKTATIVVNALPAAITGASSVVVGSSVTLACATSGGAWSSSSPSVATVGTASGAVTGVAPGAVTISYVVTSTGCRSTKAMTVNPVTLAKPNTSGGVEKGSVITVYPNPTQGVLTIEATASGNFKVFTLDSKQLAEYRIASPSTMIKLPADMPAGIYMCRFTAEDGTVESIRLVYSPR